MQNAPATRMAACSESVMKSLAMGLVTANLHLGLHCLDLAHLEMDRRAKSGAMSQASFRACDLMRAGGTRFWDAKRCAAPALGRLLDAHGCSKACPAWRSSGGDGMKLPKHHPHNRIYWSQRNCCGYEQAYLDS